MASHSVSKSMDALGLVACSVPGIGFLISNKELVSNEAIITTTLSHDFILGDSVLVIGVGAPFDGQFIITAVTSTTFTYAVTNGNISSAAATGACSVRVSQGKRRFSDDEDFEEKIRALSAETKGWFCFWVEERTLPTSTEVVGNLLIKGELLVHLPKDTTTHGSLLYDFVEDLFLDIMSDDAFNCGAFNSPGTRPRGSRWFSQEKDLSQSIKGFGFELNQMIGHA